MQGGKESVWQKRRLRKLITTTLDEQVRGIVQNFINAQWAKLQNSLDAFIEKHASDAGLKAKHTMDFVCRKIFIMHLGLFSSC